MRARAALATTPLPTTTLGVDGPEVTRMGLGLAALGRPAYINLGHGDDLAALPAERPPAAMEAHCHAVLDAAWDCGIRLFDAARGYGAAEAFLASWLRTRDRAPGSVAVTTKWGYEYTAGWHIDAEEHERKSHTAGMFRSQWARTRELLGPWLVCEQVHSVTPDSPFFDDPALLDALGAVSAGGTMIGVSTSGPSQTAAVERAIAVRTFDDRPLVRSVQATWNLLEPSVGDALAAAHAGGVGVIVKEALANGRLAGRDPSVGTDDSSALAAALAQPWADVVLSGAATVDQVVSNVRAFTAAPATDVEAEPPDSYWSTRSSLAWN